MKDGLVLGHGDLVGGVVERPEVGILGAAVDVAELGQLELEAGPHLNQRQHAPLHAGDPFAGGRFERDGAPEVGGRVLPAVRPREVDELAGRERGREPLARLVVEFLPSRVADRRQRTKQMVHRSAPFRLPIPSEPAG